MSPDELDPKLRAALSGEEPLRVMRARGGPQGNRWALAVVVGLLLAAGGCYLLWEYFTDPAAQVTVDGVPVQTPGQGGPVTLGGLSVPAGIALVGLLVATGGVLVGVRSSGWYAVTRTRLVRAGSGQTLSWAWSDVVAVRGEGVELTLVRRAGEPVRLEDVPKADEVASLCSPLLLEAPTRHAPQPGLAWDLDRPR